MLKYAVLILWRKKGVAANFYAFCISGHSSYFSTNINLNLSRDESNLVMKVMIVKELMTGDVSPVAMFLQL